MATIERRLVQTGPKEDGTPIRETHFRVKIRLRGQPAQSATFERRTDAKAWAQETESAIRQGRYFKDIEAKRHTFGELIDRYIQDVLPQKGVKTQRGQKMQLLWWKSRLGHSTLMDVTPSLLADAKAELLRGTTKPRAPATVVRYFAAVSHAFSIAVRELHWIDSNPVEKIQKPRVRNERTRYLSDDERKALLSACRQSENPYLHLIVVIALNTGARKGEILSLRWDDVDLDRGQITLLKTKNGEVRGIALSQSAKDALTDHSKVRRLDTKLLFPRNEGDLPYDIRTAWETARKRAKLENFRFHDLRHSCASYLAMSGASLRDIMEVLGHKTTQMSTRYSHLSLEHQHKTINKMAEQFLSG